jgi:type IV pilus assembly protein PilN
MIRINLLKAEKKGKKTSKKRKLSPVMDASAGRDAGLDEASFRKAAPSFPPMALIIILAVLAAAFLYFTQQRDLTREQDLLNQVNAQKNQLKDVVQKLNEFERRKQLHNNKINLILDLQSKQGTAVIILNELSQNLPQWVWLTEAKYQNKQLDLTGKALENNLIADYISNLENSDYIGSVELLSSSQKRDGSNTYFEFKMKARYTDSASGNKAGGEGTSQ